MLAALLFFCLPADGRGQQAPAVAVERLLTGRVTDERGEPIGSAWGVALAAADRDGLSVLAPEPGHPPVAPLGPGAKARADREGRFSLRVPPGADLLVVHHPDWLPLEQPVAGLPEDPALVLDRGLVLRVKTDAAYQQVVGMLEAVAAPGFLALPSRVLTLRSDAEQADVAAGFSGLRPGRYRLALASGSGRPFSVAQVELTDEQPVHVVTMHPSPAITLLMDERVRAFTELYLLPEGLEAPAPLDVALGKLYPAGKDRWQTHRLWPGPVRLLGVRSGSRGVPPDELAKLELPRQTGELAVPLAGSTLTVRLGDAFAGAHLVRLVPVPSDGPDAVLGSAPLRGRGGPLGSALPEDEAAVFPLLPPGYYRVDVATVGGGRGAALAGQAVVYLSGEEDASLLVQRLGEPTARLVVTAQRPDGSPVTEGVACFRIASGAAVVAEAALDAAGRAALALPEGVHGWVEVTAGEGGRVQRSARAGGERELLLTLAPARGKRR